MGNRLTRVDLKNRPLNDAFALSALLRNKLILLLIFCRRILLLLYTFPAEISSHQTTFENSLIARVVVDESFRGRAEGCPSSFIREYGTNVGIAYHQVKPQNIFGVTDCSVLLSSLR